MKTNKLRKANKLIDVLVNQYDLKYIDTRYEWDCFNIFNTMKPYISVADLIDLFEDEEEYIIITTSDYKRMYLKNNIIK